MRCGRFQANDVRVLPLNDDTAFDVEFVEYEIRDNYCQLQLQVERREGFDSVTVDWGDGTVDSWTGGFVWHNYSSVGRFTIRIGREARWFRLWECYTVTTDMMLLVSRPQMWLRHWGDFIESAEASFCGWSDDDHGGLKGALPPWGMSTTNTCCCFQFCFDITGRVPEWTERITDATGTFDRCTGLAGPVPEWGKNITAVAQCYSRCAGLTGKFPRWPPRCSKFNYCYEHCTGLRGELPEWPECAQELDDVYRGCTGAVGTIPRWPLAMTMCSGCYMNCPGLTGAWTDDPAELMPEERVKYSPTTDYFRCYDVVTGCSDSLRALFWDINWGGTIPRPTPLPKWP